MGTPYRGHDAVADAAALGKQIHAMAKNLVATKKGAPGEGLDVSTLTTGLKPGMRGLPLLKPHHKSPIYAGMRKVEKTYEQSTQHQFMTFRTISTTVKDGWIRGPITARKYADKVNSFIQKIATRAFEGLVSGK
jgi:hypothetical protein